MPRSRSTGKKAKKGAKTHPGENPKTARFLGRAAISAAPDATSAVSPVVSFDTNAIMTYRELLAALKAEVAQITLGNNIIAEDNIMINHDVAINFNGFSIISNESHSAARVIDVRSGEVTLLGRGKIFAMGKNSVAIRAFGAISSGVPNYTIVTVDEEISLFAPDSYGILISPNLGVAYGLTINVAGHIYAHDGICLANGIRGYDLNVPTINIKSGAEIVADGIAGIAIEAAGYGRWNLASAHLHGAVGASLNSGILKFNQTQILSNIGECFSVTENPDALLEVSIDGGNYASIKNSIISGTPTSIKKFSARDCDFYSIADAIPNDFSSIVKTKKVAFHSDVENYLTSLAVSPTITDKDDSESILEAAFAGSEITADSLSAENQTTPTHENNETTIIFDEDEESEIEVALQREIDALDAEEFEEDLLDLSELDRLEPPSARPAKSHKKSKKFKSKRKTSIPPKTQAAAPSSTLLTSVTITELQDEATDEQEILQELKAEKVKPPQPLPVLAPAPEPTLPFTSEQDAARRALTEAIMDIRKLSSEDYDTGFSQLEQAIQQSEKMLANPFASLADICDAASTLLRAFDNLEEPDDASMMSDEELDELFYHGAVLQEMLKESKSEKPKVHKKHHKTKTLLPESPQLAAVGVPDLLEEVEKHQQELKKVSYSPITADENPNLIPSFASLTAILTRISELDLNSYTLASQEKLLNSLSLAQEILNDPHATQYAIDHLAAQLSEEIVQLVPLRQPYVSTDRYHIEPSTPAPIIGMTVASTMIDEMAPVATWSLGVTMIDEMTPFTIDASTREKMLRAMQSRFYLIQKTLSQPFVKLGKSFAAGIRAGVRAYKETLHAVSN